tara:strand:+ start:1285 stop:1677 length:393 start_codon:yes stop_codon:yes gene_type:complete
VKKIEVVAAIIYHKNKILCVQRNLNKYSYISKKYEFPGGKIESNETHVEALIREIFEELNMDIAVNDLFLSVDHKYPDFRLLMHTYKCTTKSQELVLNEHIDYKWLSEYEIENLDWAAADIPIVKKLKNE